MTPHVRKDSPRPDKQGREQDLIRQSADLEAKREAERWTRHVKQKRKDDRSTRALQD